MHGIHYIQPWTLLSKFKWSPTPPTELDSSHPPRCPSSPLSVVTVYGRNAVPLHPVCYWQGEGRQALPIPAPWPAQEDHRIGLGPHIIWSWHHKRQWNNSFKGCSWTWGWEVQILNGNMVFILPSRVRCNILERCCRESSLKRTENNCLFWVALNFRGRCAFRRWNGASY